MSAKPSTDPPLPRGRHRLPREVVLASQRERLLTAMLDSVAERGYAATRVPDVVAAARVSRNAFYELWDDKVDCFLALCDGLTDDLLEHLNAQRAAASPIEALMSGVVTYLDWWRDRPAIARAYLIELPQAGDPAVRQRERQFERFVGLFDALAAWMREIDPELLPVNPQAPRMLVVGITELVAREVRGGRLERLDEFRDDIVDLARRLLD